MNKQPHPLKLVTAKECHAIPYRGVIVEKMIGGYRLLGVTCITESQVDKIIYDSARKIKKSMVS